MANSSFILLNRFIELAHNVRGFVVGEIAFDQKLPVEDSFIDQPGADGTIVDQDRHVLAAHARGHLIEQDGAMRVEPQKNRLAARGVVRLGGLDVLFRERGEWVDRQCQVRAGDYDGPLVLGRERGIGLLIDADGRLRVFFVKQGAAEEKCR